MERIGALINKLKEQFEQNADPAQMQMTIQMIQAELSNLTYQRAKTLGTSKISVVLPSSPTIAPSQYEKYLPKEEKPVVEETDSHIVKETVLVDNGSISVVQKNGQLDMVFDPLTEIPTLSHQHHAHSETEASEVKEPESLNDKLRMRKTELLEVLKETPIKDLRKAIGINDRFVFINDLFRGDETMYERSIKTINSFNIYAEAEYWINRELKVKLGWDNKQDSVLHFYQLVKRRFS